MKGTGQKGKYLAKTPFYRDNKGVMIVSCQGTMSAVTIPVHATAHYCPDPFDRHRWLPKCPGQFVGGYPDQADADCPAFAISHPHLVAHDNRYVDCHGNLHPDSYANTHPHVHGLAADRFRGCPGRRPQYPAA